MDEIELRGGGAGSSDGAGGVSAGVATAGDDRPQGGVDKALHCREHRGGGSDVLEDAQLAAWPVDPEQLGECLAEVR